LKFLTSFKPTDPQVSLTSWETAVYATLDRAASLKRIGVEPSSTSQTFSGPTALILPRDRLGKALATASASHCDGDVLSLLLDARHSEALLSRDSRRQVAQRISKALEFLLSRTG
jgi:hypothetical protein